MGRRDTPRWHDGGISFRPLRPRGLAGNAATVLDRRLVSTPRVTTSNCSADRVRRRSMLEFFTILLAGSTVRPTLAAFAIISSR